MKHRGIALAVPLLLLAAIDVACGGSGGGATTGDSSVDGDSGAARTNGASSSGASSSSGGSGGGASSGSGGPGTSDAGPPTDVTGADGGYGPIGTRSAAGFFHPGVVATLGALNFVRDRIASGDTVLSTALAQLQANPWPGMSPANPAPLPATAHYPASGTVYCGSHSAGPAGDTSCADEKGDALAAYAHALAWYLTGQESHAQAAVTILDAWSPLPANQALTAADEGVLCPPAPCSQCGHIGYASAADGSSKVECHDNTPLQSGWVGSVWARAAELVRYTYPASQYADGWSDAGAQAFAAMLERAYVPNLQPTGALTQNGNWELAAADALMQIAVFADDLPNYRNAVTKWRNRMKLYFYLRSDGATPKGGGDVEECFNELGDSDSHGCGVDYWWGLANASGLPDGTSQESCRDLEHEQYGLGAAINAAETAAIQQIGGVDLYHDTTNADGYRLFAATELLALILQNRSDSAATPDLSNASVPSSLPCAWTTSWSWGSAPSAATCAATAFTCNGENYFSTETTGAKGSSLAVVDGAQLALGANGVYANYPVEPIWEMAYNQYVGRDGLAMPNTAALLTLDRPNGATHHLEWDTLVKYSTKGYGLPQ